MRKGYIIILTVVATVLAMTLIGYLSVAHQGFSTKEEPSWSEAFMAGIVRHVAMPSEAKEKPNPIHESPEALADGRFHFAVHCALCHANDGSGQTMIGKNIYPQTPDLRQPDTQHLTDGELFFIIKNGVRMTAMPAWSGVHEDAENWNLVHFIRHLPKLSAQEKTEMESLNPKEPTEGHLEHIHHGDAPHDAQHKM